MRDFFFLETIGDLNDPSLCFVRHAPEGIARHTNLVVGLKASKYAAPDAKLIVDERARTRLAGFVGSIDGFLVCSAQAKGIVEAHTTGSKIEFLPVSIVHRVGKLTAKVLSEEYFIANPLGGHDVLDREASTIRHASKDGSLVVEAPVFDARALETAPHLFRLRHRTTTLMISDVLVRALVGAGVGNFLVRPQLQSTTPVSPPRTAPSKEFVLVDTKGDPKNKQAYFATRCEGARLSTDAARRGKVLTGCIGNGCSRLVLERSAAKRISSACGADVALEDVTLCDREGVVSGDDYCAVTAPRIGAYADISGFLFRQEPDAVVRSSVKVVLREDRLEGVPPFFQLTHHEGLFVMHVALHRELVDAGVTNLVTIPLPTK